jgi:predicted DNA-binding transcriptional regulator AlpA
MADTTPTPQIEPLLLDSRQAAALCGISRTAWYSLDQQGKIPLGVKLLKFRRWDRRELIAWLDARTATTGQLPNRQQWQAMRGQK